MDWSFLLTSIIAILTLLLQIISLPPIKRRIWRRTSRQSDETALRDLGANGRDIEAARRNSSTGENSSTGTLKEILEVVIDIQGEIIGNEQGVSQALKQKTGCTENPKGYIENGGSLTAETSSRIRAEKNNAKERNHSSPASPISVQQRERDLSSHQDNVTENHASQSTPPTFARRSILPTTELCLAEDVINGSHHSSNPPLTLPISAQSITHPDSRPKANRYFENKAHSGRSKDLRKQPSPTALPIHAPTCTGTGHKEKYEAKVSDKELRVESDDPPNRTSTVPNSITTKDGWEN